MNYKWLNKTNCEKLILFFNGWGMDENIVSDLDFDGYDVLMFYDYNNLSLDFDKSVLDNYKSKHIIGWSMGVMVATLFDFEHDSATAISGTPFPIHNEYGIPLKIYNLTLKGFSETSVKKFMARMFLDAPNPEKFSSREFENMKTELESLAEYKSNPEFKYTRVLLPTKDCIIPPKNQINYWKDFGYEEITSAHCPFMLYKKWSELI